MIGKTTPWETIEDEEEPLDNLEMTTEIEQIVLDITESVDCLLRLSVSIQNPAPHDRFMSSAFADTDTSTYEVFDVKHVRDKFQGLEDCLAHRLGKALSRRRQYFKYREAHHQKLSHGLDLHEDTSDTEPTLPPLKESGHESDKTSFIDKDEEPTMESKLSKPEDFLDDTISTLEEVNDYEIQNENDPKSSPAREVKKPSSASQLNSAKMRLHLEDDEEPNESADEDNDENNRVRKKRTKTGDGRKFACPFYKFDSERWKNERNCCGPGWYEIHRLKEHLFRTHLLATCTRCFGHFKSEELLQKHQRTKDECVWQDESSCVIDVGAGIDSKKEKLLKARSKAEDGVGKWYEIYHILFPCKIAAKDLPTPYYDAPNGKSGLSNDDDLKRKYLVFLRREIPKIVHQQLVADVEENFQDLGATVQGRLGSWIKTAAEKCATVFQSIPTPTEAAALPNPDTRPNSREASPAAVDVGGPSFLDTFDPYAYELELPLPENFIFNFDSEIDRFQPSECLPNHDSAYGTGSYELDGSSETWNTEPGAH
ncbi:hypothetical protein K4K54_000594 [Colletotrichum sp. SAR 10_86]|nr:hypothetical protein KHU50_001017 [Colletotrichum sp. SAR 10_65]KAI8230663.1 hypothetical protein K4K54_000594 [Colletotrichum sp. SAR 10_86]KAJ5007124.1 hypothetical protein K4K48_001026 [Colletotrichum sp. SAR 10_66]